MEMKDTKQDESKEALFHHASTLEIDPSIVDALNEETRQLNKKHQYDDAVACCKKVLEIDPNNVKALGFKGFSLMRKNLYTEALACFDTVLAVDFENGYCLHWKWETLRKQQRYDEMISLSDKVSPSSSEYVHALEYKGYACYKKDRHDEAIKLLDLALGIRKEPWTLKIKFLVLFHQGRRFEEQGKFDEALLCFDKAFEIRPTNLELLKAKGRVLRNKSLITEALAVYDQILKTNPSDFGFLALNGEVFNHTEEYDAALSFLERAWGVQQYPWIPKAKSSMLMRKGCLLEEQRKYDEALLCLKEALKIKPKDLKLLEARNQTLANKGLWLIEKQRSYKRSWSREKQIHGKDISRFNAKLTIEPQQIYILHLLGEALRRKGNYRDAIQCCDAALAIDPQDLYALYLKAKSLMEEKKYNSAIKCCDVALAIDPLNTEVLDIKAESLRMNEQNNTAIQCCNLALAIKPFNVSVLNTKGAAFKDKGNYVKAIKCFDRALTLDPNDKFASKERAAALQSLQYPTPFKVFVDVYNKTFWRSNKKMAYESLIAAANDIKKPVVEQLCSILQHLFTLKFLEAKYEKNENGNYRLLPAWVGEKENLLKNVLKTWAKEKKKVTEQYQFIECLVGLYLQNWYQEGWLDADGWFVIKSQEIEDMLQLLKSMPQQFNFSTPAIYENFLLFILQVDAGFEKESIKQGILTHHIFGNQDMKLKDLMTSTLKEVEEKYFKDNLHGYQSYLDNLKEKEKTQFFALREKQLGRAYTGIYISRLPNVQTVRQIQSSDPASQSVSLDEKTEFLPATFTGPSSADTNGMVNQKPLVPLPMIPEATRMSELLNRIEFNGSDSREFGGIFISRSDIRFNCVDKDSDYTADFINLLLYPLKEKQKENIVIYPVTTLKEFPKYFGDKGIEGQEQRYAFITLHVPYNPESPENNNHWAALIIDKQEQTIFYLDPATIGIPQAVEDLRSYLKYKKPIAINTINFQQAEKAENKIRHCGVYVVEMFKVFAQYIRNNQTIIDTKKSIESLGKAHVSLSSMLKSISYGLNEAAVHRQTHIDAVYEILETLPPPKPAAESEPQKKRPLAIVKTDPDEMIRFCFRINVMGDKAQLAIMAFHEVLLGRLESRKTTSEIISRGIIPYEEQGNWAKLKKAGWMILKSAPIAGKVLECGHIGCQIVGEGLSMLTDQFPWMELIGRIRQFLTESEAPWIEPMTEHLETVKSVSKGCHGIIDLLDHLKGIKEFHGKVDDYFRKWIDGSEVDTKREYKQFYGIFRTDAGKDALNWFVHSLIDRYARQLQLLEPEGAEQLAEAIDEHLGRLFLLNFDRWKLPQWGAQKHAMMLNIMRQWVTYMGFLKETKVLLASGKTTTAQALLQQCGIYFEGNQQPIQIDVIMEWDTKMNTFTMSNSGLYGHRKAEKLLVEEFKTHAQDGGQQLQALQQFVGQKTPEELEMLKELGHVMGVQFDSDTLKFFQKNQEIKAYEEVVWQSLEKRTQVTEKKVDVVEVRLDDIEESVSNLEGQMGDLQEAMNGLQLKIAPANAPANTPPSNLEEPALATMNIPKGFVRQETYDNDMNFMRQELKVAKEEVAATDQKADVANKALTKVQLDLQEERAEKIKLQESVTALRGDLTNLYSKFAELEQNQRNHAALPPLQLGEAAPPMRNNHLQEKVVDDMADNEDKPINVPYIETDIPDPSVQNDSEQLMKLARSNPYLPLLYQPKDLQKGIQTPIQNTDLPPKQVSSENVNLGFQPAAVWWR